MLDIRHEMLDIFVSNILSTRILVDFKLCHFYQRKKRFFLHQNDNAELYFLAPIAATFFFLSWLEKSVGKKDIAESGI